MKAVLSFLSLLFFSCLSFSQSAKFERIEVRSLKFKGHVITAISNDGSLSSESGSKLVTEQAVKQYVDSRSGGVRKAGGGITIDGDSMYLGGAHESGFGYYLVQQIEEGIYENVAGILFDPYFYHVFQRDGLISLTTDDVKIVSPSLNSGLPSGSIVATPSSVKIGHSQNGEFVDIFTVATDGNIKMSGFSNPTGLKVLTTDHFGNLQLSKLIPNNLTYSITTIVPLSGISTITPLNDIVILPTISETIQLLLPDPITSTGKILYLLNHNSSTSFGYNLNYPIHKSGTISVNSISGNSEFRAMIFSDGTKWLQLN